MKNFLSLASSAVFLLFLLMINKAAAQEEVDPKDLFIEAESYFLFEEYDDALPLYQRILRVEPDNYNVIYKIGICYLNSVYQKEKSIAYLEKAKDHINLRYRDDNFREKMAPLEAYYYLGRAYHVNNRLDDAINNYEYFKKQADPDEYDIQLVEDDLTACRLAKKLLAEPVYFRPSNLGPVINSRFEESNPVISGDGNTLIFNRKLQFYTAVFLSARNEDGTWSEPVNLTPAFGLDGDSYCTGISFFGDEIFVYRSDEYDGNIYFSKKQGDKWSPLVKLNDNINTKFWESHATPSPDGQYLYFTSNRDGGYGGLDIYRSKRGPNNAWGAAVNLGPVINSPGNEDTPFLGNEGYTLFFSSQGHRTMGDYDVFVSNLKSDGTWSKPVNMGVPVNTTGKDVFYNPMSVNSFGLYAFYDENTTEGLLDIYEVEVYNEMIPRIFTVSGKVSVAGAEEDAIKGLKVSVYDSRTNELVSSTQVNNSGEYSFEAPSGSYNMVVEGAGVTPYTQALILDVGGASAAMALPLIALSQASPGAAPVAVLPAESARQTIGVKNEFYAVSDSSPVPIELLLPKSAMLNVQVFLADTLYRSEEIQTERRRFTYFFRPKPGENTIYFTAVDSDGEEYETTVVVTYYPPVTGAELTAQEAPVPTPSMHGSYIGWVASLELLEYLDQIRLEEFEDYNTLYKHLTAHAPTEGFTVEDVNEMYAILFTQMDLDEFNRELTNVHTDTTGTWEGVKEESRIPIEFLQALHERELATESELQAILLSLVSVRTDSGQVLLNELRKYSSNDTLSVFSDSSLHSINGVWSAFNKAEPAEAGHILQLTATTTNLDFFFQNLMVSSEGALNEFLKTISFEDTGIETSIDLTKYLFSQEPFQEYTAQELIESLESASVNGKFYLSRFYQMLTENASGNLRSELAEIAVEEPDYNTYEGLISYLIDQSRFKDYSRENVYSLLLDLIDIKNTDEFAAKLRSYNNSTINKALADTSLQYFSNPYELIQYLLSVADQFNFSETDINNLLIRMILEQGLSDQISDQHDNLSFRIWKDNKFVATIVLVNLVLVVLLILFLYRRKSNR